MPSPPAATPRPSVISHGTPGAFANGCRCGPCVAVAAAQVRPGRVPAAAKPTPAPRRRAGRNWTVRTAPEGEEVEFAIQGAGSSVLLRSGMVICQHTGTQGVLVCTEQTWQHIERSDDAITIMQEAQEEAKRVMPKAVVRDVFTGQPRVQRQPVDASGRPKPSNMGIKGLNDQIRGLVEDMARQTTPDATVQAEFARRYGKLRDRMAGYRREFAEAEGAFEVAQAQLVSFMQED